VRESGILIGLEKCSFLKRFENNFLKHKKFSSKDVNGRKIRM
jgi:hypothetical protein